ncbi:MAG TPA: hypothetical protein VGN71_00325, partial [Solirubrobacteraceae bacterium]|nr:hypothetical protein [Solirubrobacteraceae bacterium]
MVARAARTAGALAAAGAVLAGCGQGADQGYSNAPPASPFKVAQAGVPGAPTGGGSTTGGSAVQVAGSGTLTAFVPRGTPLRSSAGGRVVGTLPTKTPFKSPQVVTVVGQRGGWLGILTSQLPNGRVGWIRAGAGRLFRTDWSIDAIVPRRQLIVRHGSRVVVR